MTDLSLYFKFSVLPKEIKEDVKRYIEMLMVKKRQEKGPNPKKAGFLKGTFEMSDDFDEPIDDFKDYM